MATATETERSQVIVLAMRAARKSLAEGGNMAAADPPAEASDTVLMEALAELRRRVALSVDTVQSRTQMLKDAVQSLREERAAVNYLRHAIMVRMNLLAEDQQLIMRDPPVFEAEAAVKRAVALTDAGVK